MANPTKITIDLKAISIAFDSSSQAWKVAMQDVADAFAQIADVYRYATMAVKKTTDPKAELIVRLEEIAEEEFSLADFKKLEESIHALACGMLLLLRAEEVKVTQMRHMRAPGTSNYCVMCGKHVMSGHWNDECAG